MSQTDFRILATAYDYRPRFGGVATCALEMIRALGHLPGVEIRCLARDYPGASKFDDTVFFETARVPLSRNNPLASLELSRSLASELLLWRPNAILNFLWLPEAAASFYCSPLRAFLKVPYYTFAHGNEVLETGTTLYKRVRRAFSPVKGKIFRGASAVFAVSNYTARLVADECGVPMERIEIIRNGVDGREFFPEPPRLDLIERYGLQGKRIFLTVTRLEDYKGVDYGIRALKVVTESRSDVAYLVCGEGPDRPRLEALARELGVADKVVFAGPVRPGELRDHYNMADCFMLLSRLDAQAPNVEGFGIVFLEAGACGKPTIGGASGGIPDAVEDRRSGWLAPPEDERAIAEVMLECLKDQARARQFGNYARQRALKSFTWDESARKILARMTHG